MDLVAAAAERNSVELRLAPAVRSWFAHADDAGLRELDYAAVAAHIRRLPAMR